MKNKKKNKVAILLREMMETLASMAKSKSLSLSLHTRITALKLRLMVFSLLRDPRLQVPPIPNNLHSLLNRRQHQQQNKLEQLQMTPIDNGDADDKGRDAVVLYCCDDDGGKSESEAADLVEAVEEEANPVSDEWLQEAAVATAFEDEDAHKVLDELEFIGDVDGGDADLADKVFNEMESVVEGEDGNDDDAADFAQKAFDEIESEVEEGEDDDDIGRKLCESVVDLEDKIDEAADLFIRRFHEQMRMERSPIHQ